MAENKQHYLDRLQVVIERLHDCGANHRETVPVHEKSGGQTLWKGEVEVFDLYGHDQAKVCYGWSHPTGKQVKGEHLVTVLQIPPVISPETAVRAWIIRDLEAEDKNDWRQRADIQ
ncbi:MAG TPA: hypothetical protein VGY56_03740 [Verrucomicrobiae bacterium]|nr:hypothetical protein [Verrucomicrobiae bacterium]